VFKEILHLSRHDIEKTAIFDHTGVTSHNVSSGIISLATPTSTARYRIPLHLKSASTDLFFQITYSLRTNGPVATHVSVVNETVTDGRLWEIEPEDNEGTYTLNGVIKSPVGHITAYLNFRGTGTTKLTIDNLVLASVATESNLQVAFFIDPWVEREDALWKSDYIWWLGKMDIALRQRRTKVDSTYVMSRSVAALWETFKPNPEARVSVIEDQKLLSLYPNYQDGLRAQRLGKAMAMDPAKHQGLANLYQEALPAKPDIIICISDMQILKELYPDALILYRDALYCREPFPDELTSLSFAGLYKNSDIATWALAAELEWDQRRQFVSSFFPKSKPIEELLIQHGAPPGSFLLLPLQDSRHYNFYDESEFASQKELLQYVAKTHNDSIILVTQHPDCKEISDSEMEQIQNEHCNIKYVRDFEQMKNPSAQILPYCSGVVGVSTGLLIQAMLLGLPCHFYGDHPMKKVSNAKHEASYRRRLANQLLMRFFASNQYLHNPNWLFARFCALKLVHTSHILRDSLAIDLPGNVLKGLLDNRRAFTQVGHFSAREELSNIDRIRHRSSAGNEANVANPINQKQIAQAVVGFRRRIEITKLLPRGGVGIELGVAEGVFSQQILETGILAHLYSVDMYEGDRGHDVAQYARAFRRLSEFYQHSSLLRMRFEDAINLFQDEFFDFVYIDGYAHTGQENGSTIDEWYPKVKTGGILSGHDYHPKFPLVVAAVDRFAAKHRAELLFIHDDDEGNWNHGASTWLLVKV
jgi:hypothetical protein